MNIVGLPEPRYSSIAITNSSTNFSAIAAISAPVNCFLIVNKSASAAIGRIWSVPILSSDEAKRPSPTRTARANSSSIINLISLFVNAITSISVTSIMSSRLNFCFLKIVVGVVTLFKSENTSSFFNLPLI